MRSQRALVGVSERVRHEDLHVETAWTHITLNPVAVNMQCWRGERRRASVHRDGRLEIGY